MATQSGAELQHGQGTEGDALMDSSTAGISPTRSLQHPHLPPHLVGLPIEGQSGPQEDASAIAERQHLATSQAALQASIQASAPPPPPPHGVGIEHPSASQEEAVNWDPYAYGQYAAPQVSQHGAGGEGAGEGMGQAQGGAGGGAAGQSAGGSSDGSGPAFHPHQHANHPHLAESVAMAAAAAPEASHPHVADQATEAQGAQANGSIQPSGEGGGGAEGIPTINAPSGDGGSLAMVADEAMRAAAAAAAAAAATGTNVVSRSHHHGVPSTLGKRQALAPPEGAPGVNPETGGSAPFKKETPYSRSPELKVSHKLAERRRRKDMKDNFEILKGLLPNVDPGPKTSKWEILQKAVDYIEQLQSEREAMHAELARYRGEAPPLPPEGAEGEEAMDMAEGELQGGEEEEAHRAEQQGYGEEEQQDDDGDVAQSAAGQVGAPSDAAGDNGEHHEGGAGGHEQDVDVASYFAQQLHKHSQAQAEDVHRQHHHHHADGHGGEEEHQHAQGHEEDEGQHLGQGGGSAGPAEHHEMHEEEARYEEQPHPGHPDEGHYAEEREEEQQQQEALEGLEEEQGVALPAQHHPGQEQGGVEGEAYGVEDAQAQGAALQDGEGDHEGLAAEVTAAEHDGYAPHGVEPMQDGGEEQTEYGEEQTLVGDDSAHQQQQQQQHAGQDQDQTQAQEGGYE